MLKLKVNDKDIEVEEGLTVLQACEQAGAEIPRFCYHEKLSIAGNCRMCLVELEKSPKPIASCAMPAAEGMNIKTNTSLVEKARKVRLVASSVCGILAPNERVVGHCAEHQGKEARHSTIHSGKTWHG